MARGDGYDQVLSLWSIQESLLQAYRSIFITAESIVIAIAAAIASTSPYPALGLAALGCFMLWMWHKVCWNRAMDVSFTQWLLLRAEEGSDIPAPLAMLKNFQAGQIISVSGRSVSRCIKVSPCGIVNDQSFICSMTKSSTRRWMETRLPISFSVLWIVIEYLAFRVA